MSRSPLPPPRDTRLEELLADDALFGASEEERQEIAAHPDASGKDDTTYELAAASADLATLQVHALPAALEAKIAAAIPRGTVETKVVATVAPRERARGSALGWLAAAACALLAAGGWWAYATKTVPAQIVEVQVPTPALSTSASPPKPIQDPAAQRAELLKTAADVVTIAWQSTKDPGGAAVHGDVVWSESLQRGFMRFTGLAANDPAKSEYQLWVFDSAQANPIDGGVFDLAQGADLVVPIHVKLHVAQPTLFAVTVEKPGGVVVSKKEHIVAVAPVKAG